MYRLQLNVRLQQKHMEHEAFSLDEDTVRAMKILGFPDIGEDRLTVSELLEQVQGMLSDQERWIFRDYLVEGLTVENQNA